MSKTIYLVRHVVYEKTSNVFAGRLPFHLSEQGKQDAKKLRDFFSDKKITHIFTSPVQRCWETAQIISDERIPVTKDLRLAELLSAFQGYQLEDGKSEREHAYAHITELGGETKAETQERMISSFREALKNLEGNVILCSHGDPLYFLFLHLNNQQLSDDKAATSSDPVDYQSKGSVRIIEVNDDLEFSIGKLLKIENLRESI